MIKPQKLKFLYMYATALIYIVFNYASFWQFLGVVSKAYTTIIPFIATLPMFAYILLFKRTMDYRSLTVTIVLICNILLSTLFSDDMSAEIYMIIVAIFIAFVVSNILEKQQFIDCYVNIILVFAAASMIATYVFLPLDVENKFAIFPLVKVGETNYFNMFITMTRQMFGIARNSGFCREPGVYQIFLLFAIFFAIEQQKKSKGNIIKTVFLIITMLSTFSAVCYITAPICIIMLMKKYIEDPRTLAVTVLVTFLVVLLFVFVVSLNDDIINEFLRTVLKWQGSEDNDSLNVRVSGVISNITLFFEKPLFGYGLVSSWHEIINRFGYVDVTGTSFIGFSAFGAVFGVLIHYVMWQMCKTKNVFSTVVWFFTILFSTLSQNVIISNVFWILLFSAYMKETVKTEQSEESIFKKDSEKVNESV